MKDIVSEILNFVYSIAHLIGVGVSKVLMMIFPDLELPLDITDAVGFLSVLTIFLILVHAAKKVAWIIVIVGWILIIVRIVLMVLGS